MRLVARAFFDKDGYYVKICAARSCAKAGQPQPASIDFFHRYLRNSDGFFLYCKSCENVRLQKRKAQMNATSKRARTRRRQAIKKWNNIPDAKLYVMSKALPGKPKRCSSCKELWPANIHNFAPDSRKSRRFDSHCRACRRKAKLTRKRTSEGFLKNKYYEMRRRALGFNKSRYSHAFGKGLCSKEEFLGWALAEGSAFWPLFQIWQEAGYSKDLSPSIDRIDPDQGYVLGNMQFLAMRDNSSKGARVDRVLRLKKKFQKQLGPRILAQLEVKHEKN